jgi:hypothetical protein
MIKNRHKLSKNSHHLTVNIGFFRKKKITQSSTRYTRHEVTDAYLLKKERIACDISTELWVQIYALLYLTEDESSTPSLSFKPVWKKEGEKQ